MEQDRKLLEEHQVKRERWQVKEIRRMKLKKSPEEVERKHLVEERMEELKTSRKEVERISQMEEEYHVLCKMKYQLDIEIHEMEKSTAVELGRKDWIAIFCIHHV